MADPRALAEARRLLRRHGHRMTGEERRLLENLLDRIERGQLRRAEALAELARPLRARGLTPEEALRRLRRSPYHGLIERLLPPG